MQHFCPQCGEPMSLGDDLAPGAAVDCPACQCSSLLPGHDPRDDAREPAPASGGFGGAQTPSESAPTRSHPREVGLARTGALALALTVLYYAVVVRPLLGTYVGEIFGQRGWVPYVISFFSFWAAVMLVSKYRALNRALRTLELDLLPHSIALRIAPEDSPAFLSYLAQLPRDLEGDRLVVRLVRVLEHFRGRARVAEAVEQLRSEAERDENAVDSSYAMLRVFIWAIPILGFIGTVLGIGASVGGFSESVANADSLEVMKDSIGAVTSGLGVAFDTTLLALVMSILIMFPMSSLQKAEEDHLDAIEDYCRRHLVNRLDEGEREAAPGNVEDGESVIDRLADRLAHAIVLRLAESPPEAS